MSTAFSTKLFFLFGESAENQPDEEEDMNDSCYYTCT